uniref:Uncharacterized protein n=1 Tax=Glossina morsitans morsitans TaxID=37546 RepID=A0A1B0FDI5_GLOMM
AEDGDTDKVKPLFAIVGVVAVAVVSCIAVAAADNSIGDVADEVGDEEADEDVIGLSDAIKLSKSRRNLFAHIFTSSVAASATDFPCNCLCRRFNVELGGKDVEFVMVDNDDVVVTNATSPMLLSAAATAVIQSRYGKAAHDRSTFFAYEPIQEATATAKGFMTSGECQF